MNRYTGRALTGLEHLRQSVGDILSTPIGSRIMRRDYGSLVPELIDQPDNAAVRVRLNAAVAGALMRWEPRMRVTRITITRDPQKPGQATTEITGSYMGGFGRQATPVTLSVQVNGGLRD